MGIFATERSVDVMIKEVMVLDGYHSAATDAYIISVHSKALVMEKTMKPEIKETTWPERTYVVKRARLSIDQLPSFFSSAYAQLYTALQSAGVQGGMPCAIYYTIDEAKKETDVAAAIPVNGPVAAIKNSDVIVLPASKVISTTHYGPYESMQSSYATLGEYLEVHGLKPELTIEEYFTDPAAEPDTSKWKTGIHFLVKGA